MDFGPKITVVGLALNIDFSDLYFNDESSANLIYNSNTLSGFGNYQSGTISSVQELSPFGRPDLMARINADNSGSAAPVFNPFHVYYPFSSGQLASGQTYIADYFTKTTTNRIVRSQFTCTVNDATYTETGYGVHPANEWRRIFHQYTYTSGTVFPRFFVVDYNDTPAGAIYNYRTKIYKFNPINKAGDPNFYYQGSFLKAGVNIDGTIEFFNSSGSSSGSEYIDFRDRYSLASVSNPFTYELMTFIKPTTLGGRILMGKLGFNGGIYQNTTSVSFTVWNGTAFVGPSAYSTTNNTWYHLVAVFDGSFMYFYVNGSLVGSPTALSSLYSGYAVRDLGIGGSTIAANDYTSSCKVAFFRMYKQALTATQVRNNFNCVRKRFNL